MKTEGLTPETDSKEAIAAAFWNNIHVVEASFARKLERERDEARAALSGRTVSCSQCNESVKTVTELESKVATLEAQKEQWRMSSVCREKDAEIQTMREAIKEAHLELSYALGPNLGVVKNHVQKALTKLTPFLP